MTSVRNRLREALGSGAFRRYLLVRAASQMGDGLFQQAAVAVLLFEKASSNPALDLLGVTAVVIVPFSFIGPFTGVAIDRFDRRKILTYTPIVRAILAVLIATTFIGTHDVYFLIAVLLVLSLNRFFLATLAAVLPQLVPERDLVVANSASSTTSSVGTVSGHAIGTLVSEWFGGRAAAALASVGFIASGRLARSMPVRRGLAVDKAPLRQEFVRVIRETRDGFKEMQAAPRVRQGMLAIGLLQFLVGVLVAILMHYLIAELNLGPSSGFSMLAVLAVGVGAGVLIVPWITERLQLASTIRVAFLVGALGTMLPLGSLSRGLMSISAGMVGAAYALVKIPVDTIVQQDIEDEVRGRAFSFYDVLFNGSRILGTATSAIIYEFGVGTRAQMTITTIAFAAIAVGLRVPGRRVYEPKDGEPLIRDRQVMPNRPPEQVAPASAADASAATTTGEPYGPGESARRQVLDPGSMRPFSKLSRKEAPEVRPVVPPPVGSLVRVLAPAGGRAEEEPSAISLDGSEVPVNLLWRGRSVQGGREQRVIGVETSTFGARLIADADSGGWEITAVWPILRT